MKISTAYMSARLRSWIAVVAIALLTFLAGCSNGASTNATNSSDSFAQDSAMPQPVDEYGDWRTYEDELVTMRYPGEWESMQNLEEGNKLVIGDPDSDETSVVIKLMHVSHNDPNVSLDSLLMLEKNHILSLEDSEPNIVSIKRLESHSEFIYTLQLLPVVISDPMKYASYTWVNLGIEYGLRLSCSPEEFEPRYAIVSKMARSFRWK